MDLHSEQSQYLKESLGVVSVAKKDGNEWEGQSVKWKWRRCWCHTRLQSNTRWEKAEEEERE